MYSWRRGCQHAQVLEHQMALAVPKPSSHYKRCAYTVQTCSVFLEERMPTCPGSRGTKWLWLFPGLHHVVQTCSVFLEERMPTCPGSRGTKWLWLFPGLHHGIKHTLPGEENTMKLDTQLGHPISHSTGKRCAYTVQTCSVFLEERMPTCPGSRGTKWLWLFPVQTCSVFLEERMPTCPGSRGTKWLWLFPGLHHVMLLHLRARLVPAVMKVRTSSSSCIYSTSRHRVY
ncbi:hypothetical protein F7725_005662 [Dissostichus mawsoni]|uniref:Uncharacterized protein n=1 Tax=Dissostichus mawsoni TaxID=36200 RepID=A0A7J5YUY9_DISMA|nr:hypothetical protein F7725_005662 [Dissostichus mawsoni]